MPMIDTTGGSLYLDPDDPDDDVYTAEHSKDHAQAEDAAHRELGHIAGQALSLARSLSQKAGLSAGSPTDGEVSALLSQEDTATYAAMLNVLTAVRLGVRADEHGVVGDGATDDTDALHAAAAQAATLGVPLVIPAGFVVGISSYKQLPPNLELHTNGATFRQIVAMGRNPVIGLGSRSKVVGGLYVRTLGGENCQGVHIPPTSSDVTVDVVDVRSSTPGAGAATVYDNGLRVLGSNFRAERVVVENYTWPVWVEGYGHQVDWLEAKGYSLAVRLRDPKHCRINGGRVYGKSPTADYLPGYNGILIEATADDAADNVQITNFRTEDAGEHGFRVGGLYSVRDVRFSRCTAKNVGGSGFKTLPGVAGTEGNATRARGVIMDHCTVEDAGAINQNTCGFLIQRADDVRIIAPVVRKKGKTYSAVEGIRMSGVTNVTITSPRLWDTHKFGIRLDEAYGNISDVTVSDLHIYTATGHGVYLQNPGVQFRDLHFEGFIEATAADASCFYAGRYTAPTDSGSWAGLNVLRLRFSESSPAEVQVNANSSTSALAAFSADLVGRRSASAASSWPPFMPGSLFHDLRLKSRQTRRTDGQWWSI